MYRKRPGGPPEHPGAPQSTPERPRSLKLPYFYLQKAFLSEKSIQLPLFCRTKRTSEPKITLFLPTKSKKSIQIPRHTRTKHTSSLKLPYFYLQKPKSYTNTSAYPHQTPIGEKFTLFLPKKKPPDQKARIIPGNPDPAGNPSKNTKKQHKKPLPPGRQACGREEGGWLGWLGWAGWVTAEAGLAGLAGLAARLAGWLG